MYSETARIRDSLFRSVSEILNCGKNRQDYHDYQSRVRLQIEKHEIKLEAILFMFKTKRIALLIRSLDYGGTEMQLTTLANGLAGSGFAVSVLVFYPSGSLQERLSADVTVRCLEKRGRWDVIGFLRSLYRVLDE